GGVDGRGVWSSSAPDADAAIAADIEAGSCRSRASHPAVPREGRRRSAALGAGTSRRAAALLGRFVLDTGRCVAVVAIVPSVGTAGRATASRGPRRSAHRDRRPRAACLIAVFAAQ